MVAEAVAVAVMVVQTSDATYGARGHDAHAHPKRTRVDKTMPRTACCRSHRGADLPYSYGEPPGLALPLKCTCAGLHPSGNTSHCLQSSEEQGAAQAEGYGQYYAGNVWNARTDPQCVFTYYKNFRQADNVTIDFAPSAKSCNQAVRWGETYCARTERATEYDWMGFYTAISRSTSGTIPQTDLKRVYGRLCTGSPTGICDPISGAPPTATWSRLDSAAQAEFGQGSERYGTFINRGSTYGVTR
jgi:hypothetical protein